MAGRLSLSKLRLSPYYGKLSKFHASEAPATLGLEVEEGEGEEIPQICKHLDLECHSMPTPRAGVRLYTVKRQADPFADEEEAEAEAPPPAKSETKGAAAKTEPPPIPVPTGPRKRSKHITEVDFMLASAPQALGKLSKFYNGLMDAFPGFQVKLAKALGNQLRMAGYTAPESESSSSSSSVDLSSSASSDKKKKKKKKKAKKKGKKQEKKAAKEAKAQAEEDGEKKSREELLAPDELEAAKAELEAAANDPAEDLANELKLGGALTERQALEAELAAELAAVPSATQAELAAELAAGASSPQAP